MRTRSGLSLWIELVVFACSGTLLCALAPDLGQDAAPEPQHQELADGLQQQRDRVDLQLATAIEESGVDADAWLARNDGRDSFVEHLQSLGVDDIWYVSSCGDPEEQADTVIIALPEDPELRGPVFDAFWQMSQQVNALAPEQSIGSRYAGIWMPASMY